MSFVKVTTSLWEALHKPNKSIISVTNFITYLGYGYKPSLFREEKPSKYLDLCLEHGKRFEPICVEVLKKLGNHIIRLPQGVVQVFDDKLMGTPDGFIVDQFGDLGVLEIKCPFGGRYGQFNDEEEIVHDFQKKHFRHWLQLQLYLFLNKERGTEFGVLAYYYPTLKQCYVYTFLRDPGIGELVASGLENYFEFFEKGGGKKEPFESSFTEPIRRRLLKE
jgi:YqaJ-like viral recombinase domain